MSTKETKLAGIGRVPSLDDKAEVERWIRSVSEILQVRAMGKGDPLDKNITLRELQRLNLTGNTTYITTGTGGTGGTGGSGGTGTLPDYTAPPAPTSVDVIGGTNMIFISWAAPDYFYFSYAEIWRATSDNLSSAVLIGTSDGSLYIDEVGWGSAVYYYWVRFVSTEADTGPWNDVHGLPGQSALNPEYVVEQLTGRITATQLAAALGARINLIDQTGGLVDQVNGLTTSMTTANGTLSAHASALSGLDARVTDTEDELVAQAATISTLAAGVSVDYSTLDLVTAWKFDRDAKGWTDSSGAAAPFEITENGAWVKVHGASYPLTSPVFTKTFNGAQYFYVLARVKRIVNSTAQVNATLDYQVNADTAFAGSPKSLTITNADLPYNQWKIVQFDMRLVTAGATAWNTNIIKRIRLALAMVGGSSSTPTFEVDWIAISRTPQIQNIAIQQEQVVRASQAGDLYGQYSVKIDANGYVTGYGFSYETVNGTPTSSFIVKADNFAIGLPSYPDVYPFTVGTVGGTPVVGITGAAILDATIQSAKIVSLAANKITAGKVTAKTVLGDGALIGGQIAIGSGGPFGVTYTDYDSNGNAVSVQKSVQTLIDTSGKLWCNNAYVRGNVEATSLKADSAEIVKTIHLGRDQVIIPWHFTFRRNTNIEITGGEAIISTATSHYGSSTGNWDNIFAQAVNVESFDDGQKILVICSLNLYVPAYTRIFFRGGSYLVGWTYSNRYVAFEEAIRIDATFQFECTKAAGQTSMAPFLQVGYVFDTIPAGKDPYGIAHLFPPTIGNVDVTYIGIKK